MINKATVNDVKELHKFLLEAAKGGEILPRSLNELYAYLRDYWVYRAKKNAPIQAAAGMHICWEDLAEVRNLYVDPKLRGKGIGEKLLEKCIGESRQLKVGRIFALTYRESFFTNLGFKHYDKSKLPHKVWADCLQCIKFPDCDEDAVMFNLKKDKFKPRKKKR